MAYGTVKVDNITFDNGGSDQNVTVSGLYNSLTSGVSVTGTISGSVVIGSTSVSGTTVLGTTVTGTTVQGVSGTFTSLTGTTITGTTINGVTVTSTTGTFTSLTGTTITGTTINGVTVAATTGSFTSLTGTTTSGTTANFVSGVFTTQVSGTTVTGTTSSFTSGNFTTLSGATATFTSGVLALGTATNPSLSFASDPNTGIYSPGADQVAVATNGTGRLFVDASGQVGLNTAPNAARDFAIFRSSFPTIQLVNTDTGTTATDGFLIQQGALDAYLVNRENGNIRFLTNNTEHLRITSTGQLSHIGAGSSGSPAVSFNGSAPSNSLVITSAGLVGIGTSAPSESLQVETTGNNAILLNSPGNRSNSIGFQTSGINKWWMGRADSDQIAGDPFFIGRDLGNVIDKGGNSASLVINSSGNVGIGTTSPGKPLDVRASDSEVRATCGSLNYTAFLAAADSGASCRIGAYRNSWGFLGTQSNHPLLIETNSAERARIDASGGFRVKGAGTAGINDAFFVNGSAPASSVQIDSSGRLLVGTSSAYSVPTADGALRAPGLQRAAATFADSAISAVLFNTSASGGASLSLGRSNTTSIGSQALAANNDVTGSVHFSASDGVAQVRTATIFSAVDSTPGANDMPGRLVFSTTPSGLSTPTERMRINNAGRVNFNTGGAAAPSDTVNGTQIHEDGYIFCSVNAGTAGFFNRNTSDGTLVGFRRSNVTVGTISVTTTATAYNTSSDYRLKENVTPVSDGITRLQQLKPSRFNFIADPDTVVDGFLAHEVQTIVPEAITGEKDAVDDEGNPEYQGIDQSKLVPLLTAALQEAVAKIESLEARLTAAGI